MYHINTRSTYNMINNYNTNYTIEDINDILVKIKEHIRNGRYKISLNRNRQNNLQLIQMYNLNTNRIKNILLSIEATDFCYSTQNRHINYSNEVLYIFAPTVELIDIFGEENTVTLYIKFNIIDSDQFVIVISFHELQYSINYLFR